VALARALAASPSVLLLDEPFSNLDAKLRERSRKWLRALQQEIGITTIFVTHDQDEALGMSDRVMVMDHGLIQQSGTPEDIYRRPASRAVADFVGRCNLLEGRVLGTSRSGGIMVGITGTPLVVEAQAPGETAGPGDVMLALRPEAIELSEGEARQPNQCQAEVRSGAFLGDHYEYELSLGGVDVVDVVVQTAQAVTGTTTLLTVPDLASTVVR
jgi:iron(III) transport system ATP-binding protein